MYKCQTVPCAPETDRLHLNEHNKQKQDDRLLVSPASLGVVTRRAESEGRCASRSHHLQALGTGSLRAGREPGDVDNGAAWSPPCLRPPHPHPVGGGTRGDAGEAGGTDTGAAPAPGGSRSRGCRAVHRQRGCGDSCHPTLPSGPHVPGLLRGHEEGETEARSVPAVIQCHAQGVKRRVWERWWAQASPAAHPPAG